MSKARTLAGTVSTGAVLADGTLSAAEVTGLPTFPAGTVVGATDEQTLTNKTLTDPKLTLGGGNGTAGQVPVSAGAGVAPTWGNRALGQLQEFTSSGTWTKPAGANFVMVEAWGAGGGGGSGTRYSGGTLNRNGGGGGAGGGAFQRIFKASELSSTVAVVIGAGGAGGAVQTVDSTDGNAGSAGSTTTFGILSVSGGAGGAQGRAGQTTSAVGGGFPYPIGVPNLYVGGNGGSVSASGQPSSSSPSYFAGNGGGAGSSFNATDVLSPSAAGGASYEFTPLGAIFPGATGMSGASRSGASGGGAGGSFQNSLASNQTMCFGNSTFAYATTEGFIATSANGTTGWTFRSAPNGSPVTMILHDGTKFVVFNAAGTACWTTTDFVTFTARTGLTSGLNVLNRAKYVNGNYFLVGNLASTATIFRSTDLITWTQITTGNGGTGAMDICWTGTNYVVVSLANPGIRYSSDLTTWTSASGGVGAMYSCESNGSGTVVVQNTNAIQLAARSTDHGATFTAVTTTLANPTTHRSIAFLNSTWFLSADTSLYTSTDGTTYTSRTNPTSAAIGGGFAYDGTTYALGSTAASSTTAAITAVPAALGTWTTRTMTALTTAGGAGGAGGLTSGGGGGGASLNGYNSGAGGAGGNGLVRVYTW